jgi:hypothetical protein
MLNFIFDCFIRGDMRELSKISIEFRFSFDNSIPNSLCIFPFEFESIFFFFNDYIRIYIDRGLLESFVALARP